MKNLSKIFFLIVCLLYITGCNNEQTEENETVLIDSNISEINNENSNSIPNINTQYTKINEYVNSLFNELMFNDTFEKLEPTTDEDYINLVFMNSKGDTIYKFYFDKNENLKYILILYDKSNDNSKLLAKKFILFSKFNFTADEINKINNIIDDYSSTNDVEIGNYYISNLHTGFLTIKVKDTNETNKSSSNSNITSNEASNKTSNEEKKSNSSITSNKVSNKTSQVVSNKTSNKTSQVVSNKTSNKASNKTTSNTNTLSVSRQNALKSAQSYLKYMPFSRSGLIEQLEYEKYSHADAVYAVDHCGANWKEQALKAAKSYLKSMAFSKKGLIEQLEFEGFTSEQATYGVNNCGANWKEQAKKAAASYLKHMSFSRQGLIEQLEFEGFTHEQAVYGVTQNGL